MRMIMRMIIILFKNASNSMENKNPNFSFLTALVLIFYWFYVNICFGYFLSKIFYKFFNSNGIKFRKKISLKKKFKILISFFWKLIKNHIDGVGEKLWLLMRAINNLIIALLVFLKKFLKFKRKFKRKFMLIKEVLLIFEDAFLILCSFLSEFSFFKNLWNWLFAWMSIVSFLMSEWVFIRGIVYALYLILIGIFGVLLGFFLGSYRRYKEDNELSIFFLLLLLKILYNSRFNETLLEPLGIFYLDLEMEEFSKISLKINERIHPRLLKIILTDTDVDGFVQIPSPVLPNPFVNIEIDFILEESINYKFELFKFYIKQNNYFLPNL